MEWDERIELPRGACSCYSMVEQMLKQPAYMDTAYYNTTRTRPETVGQPFTLRQLLEASYKADSDYAIFWGPLVIKWGLVRYPFTLVRMVRYEMQLNLRDQR